MRKLFTIIFILSAFFAEKGMSQVIMRYGPEIDAGWGDANSVITPYVYFPEKFTKPYAGNSITKVYIGLAEDAANCYLYIKDKPETQENRYKQKLGELKSGWNEIELDTPFEIPEGEGLAIGYKASFSKKNGAGYSSEKFSDGDHVYYNSKNTWTSTGGSLCIKALVEGDAIPINEMMIGKLADKLAGYDDKTVTYSVAVRNVGANAISNYEFISNFDGEETTISVEKNIAVNESDTIYWEVPSTEVGTHNIGITISKVNGHPDAYADNNETVARLTVRDRAFARRVVCEEYGGTWCGFCPRGIVGLELMSEKHPGDFIGISVHGGDALEINPQTDYSYSEFIESCPGAPLCNVNRKLTGDPYVDIESLYELERKSENHIAYEISAKWNDEGTAIEVVSTYYSDIEIPSPKFNIAYTLTEDNITGYAQTNYYAGGKNGELYGWEDKDSPTTDFVYNDIARCIYGGYKGMECRREPMTAFEKYEHNATVSIPRNVADAHNLKITGQIIDSASGCIVNAMRVTPEGTPSGIATVSADSDCRIIVKGSCISVSVADDKEFTLTLYTLDGAEVKNGSIKRGHGEITVNQPGFYLVSVMNGTQKVCNRKVIINSL